MIFFDTETVGFHGAVVLIQYAIDDGPIILHEVWYEPVQKTLDLIEMIVHHKGGVCGFNLAFDWFHLCKLYNTLSLVADKNIIPNPDEVGVLEWEGTFGPCLKPQTACDLFLHARKGRYQSIMKRKEIAIRRVPAEAVGLLQKELDNRLVFNPLLFAGKTNPYEHWIIRQSIDENDNELVGFVDLVLNFKPSGKLKDLAQYALGFEEDLILKSTAKDVNKVYKTIELGYAPYATAPFKPKDRSYYVYPSPENWYFKWPQRVKYHAQYWHNDTTARKYAKDDVIYTRALYEHFNKPESGDTDSILACMVGACRYKGYNIDIGGMKELRQKAIDTVSSLPINHNSPKQCKEYLLEVMSQTEQVLIKRSTKKTVLEKIAKWFISEVCTYCDGVGCEKCKNGLIDTDERHPAAERAQHILDSRAAAKEIENYDKLIAAGKFFASFVVIGTKSDRMAGADDLNAQGIKRSKHVRSKFPLAEENYSLEGGDFDAFEISILDAVYSDPRLHTELESGKKIHAILGQYFFPHLDYDKIIKSKGAADGWKDYYTRSKNGVFALVYMGEAYTLSNRVGIPEDQAEKAYDEFTRRYPDFGEKRKQIINNFTSLKQPNGPGTEVHLKQAETYAESMFGFKRDFSIEDHIIHVFYELAQNLPDCLKNLIGKVVRRQERGKQTVGGAVQTALYGAAFGLQGAIIRAAGNHYIQSPGAKITKEVEAEIWTFQPCGIHKWIVQPINVHDEILSPVHPNYSKDIKKAVHDKVESFRPYIPLIGFQWEKMKTWAEKN